MTERDVQRVLPLRPRTFAILLALADGPRHGYGLMRELQEDGEDQLLLGPATLYRILKQLQDEGMITSAEGPGEESDGPPRRYYQLSGFGRRVAEAETARMRGLVARAERVRLVGG